MAEWGRGIKAGLVAASVFLVIAVILELSPISMHIGRGYWAIAAGLVIHPWVTVSGMIMQVTGRIMGGLVFGAVFAALHNHLPGGRTVVKGAVLALFLWILVAVKAIYMTPGWPAHGAGISTWGGPGITVTLSSIGLASASIISAVAFGALVGAVWNRLREKKVAEARKGTAALLVGSILGGLVWVFTTMGFIVGVVIGGAPVIGPELAWMDILAVSIVFLGPAGWILALIAWRRAKSDESGFKWGVAGGAIMTLTGVILLPGVLAIIGGVLSRRSLPSEAKTAETEQ